MELNRINKVDDLIKINNVLISTADKTNLKELVLGMLEINSNLKIYSTGGTYITIKTFLNKKQQKNLNKVSDYTHHPEMQGGLVKTLDYKIYLGLLSETANSKHQEDLHKAKAQVLDMVVVNLYPFKEVIKSKETTLEDARAHIDIGGPCMLRAAAKNYLRVASVCNPKDYNFLLSEIKNNNSSLTLKARYYFAKKAFKHTAEYDSTISKYLLSKNITGEYDVR